MRKRYDITSYEMLKNKLKAAKELGLKCTINGTVKNLIYDTMEDLDSRKANSLLYTDFRGHSIYFDEFLKHEGLDPINIKVKKFFFNKGQDEKTVEAIQGKDNNIYMVEFDTLYLYIELD